MKRRVGVAWAWIGEPHVALITLLSWEMNDNVSGKCMLVFKHIISEECTTTTYAPSTFPSPLPLPVSPSPLTFSVSAQS